MSKTTGICRCCLHICKNEDIKTEYKTTGSIEVYAKMLKECFLIYLTPIDEGLYQTTICESCIGRLQDAFDFRKQVLESENTIMQKLKDVHDNVVSEGDGNISESQFSDDIKPDAEGTRNDFQSISFDSDDDIKAFPIKIEKVETELEISNTIVEKKTTGIRKRNSKLSINGVKDSKGQLVKKNKAKKIKESDDQNAFRRSIVYEQKKRTIHSKLQEYNSRMNALIILENTTSTPFRWSSQRGFICFYCTKSQPNIETLRAHTETHKQEKLKSLISKKCKQRFIKVDVTDMNCKLCTKNIQKLPDAKTHLTTVHNKKFFRCQHDNILPYRLSNTDLNCAICDKTFTNFHTLNMHMNTHFGNYVCESCGATFINEERLNIHLGTHENGVYPCNSCTKNFNSPVKLSNHKAVAHSSRNHRCHSCGETFKSFHLKQTHRIKVHDEIHLLHTCEFCDKSYPRRSHLNYHIRRTHLREKNFVCEVCSDGFFSKKELADHNLKHSGEKAHECEVCSKRFGRKHSLVEHMRIHNNDRRFVCAYCGQGFIQKCSLKGHLKTHHSVTL